MICSMADEEKRAIRRVVASALVEAIANVTVHL